MAINTNHSQESLTPESGILKIVSDGALALPKGDELTRPIISAAGYIRFANNINKPEYFDGDAWQTITNKSYVDSIVGSTETDIETAISNLTLSDLSDVQISSPTNNQVLIFDSVLGQFRTQTQSLTPITKSFIADGVTMTFDIGTTVSSIQNLLVSVNGVQQEPYYSFTIINDQIVVFDEVPELGDRVQVKVLRSNTATDRPRPVITNIIYGTLDIYSTITIVANDITYGTGVKIGNQFISRIDYPLPNTMQIMLYENRMNDPIWETPQDLTLVDTSGNEFVFKNLINVGANRPQHTKSSSYIGTFSGGETINFALGINNSTNIQISSVHSNELELSWISISGSNIVGVAPVNSSPSRYEFIVTASNNTVQITKNYWLLVI